MSKTCTLCGVDKGLSEFHKRSASADGLQHKCKVCHTAAVMRSRLSESGKQVHVRASTKWRAANMAAALEWNRASQKRHPAKARARARQYQMRKRNATPKWADQFFMEEVYHLAHLRSKMTGFPWHVDHIVPMRSRIVCGLHCEANLQVIAARTNMTKSNRYWPDMPGTFI